MRDENETTEPLDFERFGADLQPDDVRDFRIAALIGDATDDDDRLIPESYLVPQYRHLFDGEFAQEYAEIEKCISRQFHDDCCGQGYRYQNARPKEGRYPSSRDSFRQAKRLDGYPVESFGTTLNASQDAGVNGCATERTVPDVRMTRRDLVSLDDVTGEVLADREANRNGSYYSVPRTQFRRAMMHSEMPIQTSYMYHTGDRAMRTNGGVMGFASGKAIAGHCQTAIGWIRGSMVFLQSWGTDWGDRGIMHVPDGVIVRFGSGRISVPMPVDLSKLLRKYDGLNLLAPNGRDHYRCEQAVLRRYPDEITWWAFGNRFTDAVTTIPRRDFDAVPKGADMDIDCAPMKTRELVREIRQHFGAN